MGQEKAIGRTPGEALDQLHQADAFFTAAQRQRLQELMDTRDQGALTEMQAQELLDLIDAEVEASGKRAQAWHRALHP